MLFVQGLNGPKYNNFPFQYFNCLKQNSSFFSNHNQRPLLEAHSDAKKIEGCLEQLDDGG